MTGKCSVTFTNDSIAGKIPELSGRFLLFRPVKKYEVNVHESVGLQGRVFVCTCFSLCDRSLSPLLCLFLVQEVTFRGHEKKNRKKNGTAFCVLFDEEDCAEETVQRQTANARAAEAAEQERRPLLLSLHHNKRLQKQPPFQSTASAYCQKQERARRQTRTVVVHPPKKHAFLF
jgi:hypothetical protein